MKKTILFSACAALSLSMVACGGNPNKAKNAEAAAETKAEAKAAPVYNVIDKPQVDLATLPVDKEGYYVIFDGKTFNGWRGYGKDNVPAKWTIDDGAIKFNGTGGGEAQKADGGDLIFAHKFKNFELTFEYKVSKGANSGVFYLAQEVTVNNNGKDEFIPIWQSASEYQVLDNANHPDAQLGVDGNRQSASLYDMIPAKPQNAKPYGEWNTGKIMVYEGTVIHGQNGKNVVEYHLWTPKWKEMLDNSKFKADGDFPIAYKLLLNMGGDNHEGYIAFQDHGDDVWYRNVKVKVLK